MFTHEGTHRSEWLQDKKEMISHVRHNGTLSTHSVRREGKWDHSVKSQRNYSRSFSLIHYSAGVLDVQDDNDRIRVVSFLDNLQLLFSSHRNAVTRDRESLTGQIKCTNAGVVAGVECWQIWLTSCCCLCGREAAFTPKHPLGGFLLASILFYFRWLHMEGVSICYRVWPAVVQGRIHLTNQTDEWVYSPFAAAAYTFSNKQRRKRRTHHLLYYII